MSLTSIAHLARNVSRGFYTSCKWKSDSKHSAIQKDNADKEELNSKQKLPQEPSNCCMSGCVNCVWIKYAQELTELFDNGDVIARNKIMEKVQDPKLRTFLLTQLGLQQNETKE